MPPVANVLNVVVGTLKETSAPPRPVQHLPEEICLSLSPTRALPAGNHAPTMTTPGSCWSYPATPVAPRSTGALNIVPDVRKETCTPHRPEQHLSTKNCLSPTQQEGALPAENHAPTTSPTIMFRPGSCWPGPTAAADTGQGVSVGVGVRRTGVLTHAACDGKGTREMVTTTPAPPPPSLYPPHSKSPLARVANSPPRVSMPVGVPEESNGVTTNDQILPLVATTTHQTMVAALLAKNSFQLFVHYVHWRCWCWRHWQHWRHSDTATNVDKRSTVQSVTPPTSDCGAMEPSKQHFVWCHSHCLDWHWFR
jgi:hypothetical protein